MVTDYCGLTRILQNNKIKRILTPPFRSLRENSRQFISAFIRVRQWQLGWQVQLPLQVHLNPTCPARLLLRRVVAPARGTACNLPPMPVLVAEEDEKAVAARLPSLENDFVHAISRDVEMIEDPAILS